MSGTCAGVRMKSVVLGVVVAAGISASAPAFDPKPWLADLDQVHDALANRYANLEWAVFTREADLPGLFQSTKTRIEAASNDADARAAFDRFARKLGDGHVVFAWPRAKAPNTGVPADQCQALGYDAISRAGPLAAYAPGYRAIETPQSGDFPAGMIAAGDTKVGVVKIGVFMPQGFPALCEAALATRAVPAGKPCDDACSDAIDAWVTA